MEKMEGNKASERPRRWKPCGSPSFPVFSWDEEDEVETKSYIIKTGHTEPNQPCVYNHGATRIDGMAGLLVDTGAVHPLIGADLVQRQSKDAAAHGYKTKWLQMQKPKTVSGVGDTAKTCTHQVHLPGMLENGELIEFVSPVIPPPSAIPGLYPLENMAANNTYFGTHNGMMAMIPTGADGKIQWPQGTKFINCRKAPSGHWILIISAWKRTAQLGNPEVSKL